MNRIMNVLATGFYRAKENQGTLESARNKVRRLLHQRNPALFPYGQIGTPINEMMNNCSGVIMLSHPLGYGDILRDESR